MGEKAAKFKVKRDPGGGATCGRAMRLDILAIQVRFKRPTATSATVEPSLANRTILVLTRRQAARRKMPNRRKVGHEKNDLLQSDKGCSTPQQSMRPALSDSRDARRWYSSGMIVVEMIMDTTILNYLAISSIS
jgi:hypothetical protein